MSDTTITAEEMAEIRRRFEILRRGHPITGSFSLGVHMDGYLRNYAHGFEVNFIGLLDAIEQAEARAEKAEAENARLRAELETAKQVAASAQAVAQEAWAGEIPSPLPGHKRANEEELLAQVEHINCPLCGGSGHIGDCEGD